MQGVGFRPFVFRLASEMHLTGYVSNHTGGVIAEAEGPPDQLEHFRQRVLSELPPNSFISSCEATWLDEAGYSAFEIRESEKAERHRPLVLPDLATCGKCLDELFDPDDRRYRYPFINCTHCGPRFSIIHSMPYDRPNTAMSAFPLCRNCREEYEDPENRRFHAQPNACPACGPQLSGHAADGTLLHSKQAALLEAAERLKQGQVIALKGMGGFQLLVDAQNAGAVARLRERKHRDEKPFAVMVATLDDARREAELSPDMEQLLCSAQAPILIAPAAKNRTVDRSVAPGNPAIGIMLPCTPLHHLLLRDLNRPLVATSGNRSDEPICTDNEEAFRRLAGLADYFLCHDRPILRHVDDSIVRIVCGREMVLRRARGYAPLPLPLPREVPSLMAAGGHLKNSLALAADRQVYISQHIGDLETHEANDAFIHVAADLQRLLDIEPSRVMHDAHPDYVSTRYALNSGKPVVPVQHHYAHILSAMAENELEGPVLGIAWDGTGYGTDGTIWGGEFLVCDFSTFNRFAHLRPFRLPGGEAAVREPRRCALGLLHGMPGSVSPDQAAELASCFSQEEWKVLNLMLNKELQAPLTTSMGRLFDGFAALCGSRDRLNFEGQAAMELEWAVRPDDVSEPYPVEFIHHTDAPVQIDWSGMVQGVWEDRRAGYPVARCAGRVHRTLVRIIVETAELAENEHVVLSGGCFQNRILTEWAVEALQQAGFKPYWHQRVPPNDGGLALGQAAHAMRKKA